MNYKIKNDSNSNYLYHVDDQDSIEFVEKNDVQETKEILIQTILNFENSDNPFEDIKTIHNFLKRNKEFNADEYLSQCDAINKMFYHLYNEDNSFVKDVLSTLCCLSTLSEIVMIELCNHVDIFTNLLENKQIVQLMPDFSMLLHQLIRYDEKGESIYKLVNDFNFIGKIIDIFKPPFSDQYIFNMFVDCIICVLKKYFYFSHNILPEDSEKDENDPYVYGLKLLLLPLSVVQEFIVSDDKFTLYPVLKLYRTILINRRGEIKNYLCQEVFEAIINLLRNSQDIDNDGIVLKKVLKIIDVIIFIYLKGNTIIDDTNRLEQIISSLIYQINRISEIDPNDQIDKTKEYLPHIINLLERISRNQIAAEFLSEKETFINFLNIYNNKLDYSIKNSSNIIFLNVFDRFGPNIVDDFDDEGTIEDNYNFIPMIFNDSIESIDNFTGEEQIKKVNLICSSLFKILSRNEEIKNLFDEEEVMEFLDKFEDDLQCFDQCRQLRELLMRDLDDEVE